MSYKLEYPYTEEQRENFIVEYNHTQGLRIETLDNIVEEERTQEITEERDVLDEEGNVIGTETVVVDTEVYYEAVNYPTHYALEANEIMEGGEPIVDVDYEAKQAQKKAVRIANLHITKQDFYNYLCKPAGITYKELLGAVEQVDMQAEWDLCNHVYYGIIRPFLSTLPLGKTEAEVIAVFEKYTKD